MQHLSYLIQVNVALQILLLLPSSWGFYKPQLTKIPLDSKDNVGYPSFVTMFLDKGDYISAQENSSVSSMKGNIKSYAGFFTVDKAKGSNMFFWYFPSEDDGNTPVVLWLQGGPGVTSLVGVFEENGPFSVKKSHGLKLRRASWTKKMNVLYIDNPVGTGFSFTNSDDGYSKSEADVSKNLLNSLLQFFIMFPDLKSKDFYIAGESYAGKYVPMLASSIDLNNRNAKIKINLKGISIGNGFIDPFNMMSYGAYLYQIGLIDFIGIREFQKKEKTIQDLISSNKNKEAFKAFDELLNGDATPYKTLFYNFTHLSDYMNYMNGDEESPFGDFSKYIQSPVARRSIHVGNIEFHTESHKVENYLINDFMQSVSPTLIKLLDKYRVLIYNGQFDIIVAYPLTVNSIVKSMKTWSSYITYMAASRQPFFVDNEIAGYYKKAGNLIEVMVRDAGHMVPKDQPDRALELIRCFTYNDPKCFNG